VYVSLTVAGYKAKTSMVKYSYMAKIHSY